MRKTFKVAGHKFVISMPDEHPLWNRMDNYRPFLCEDDAAEQTIFEIGMVEPFPVDGKSLVLADPAEDELQPKIEIYRLGEDWLFEVAPVQKMPVCGRILLNGDYTRGCFCVSTDKDNIVDFVLNNALMLTYAFRTATLGTLEMHSSVVVNGGKGYMFLGKSGTGKSTHSQLWLDHVDGSHLLNDDNPVVRVFPDGRMIVYGTPWSGKTPCYRNEEAPVGAIVRLRQCKQNIITRMGLPEAFASVYSSSSGFKANKTIADGLYETTAALVTGVGCYLLDCLPDEDAARLSSETIR